jgi:hypothetical protein
MSVSPEAGVGIGLGRIDQSPRQIESRRAELENSQPPPPQENTSFCPSRRQNPANPNTLKRRNALQNKATQKISRTTIYQSGALHLGGLQIIGRRGGPNIP